MISRAFSDGVSLRKDGPQLTKAFSSELVMDAGMSYVAAAEFISKWVAKHFVTTLTVDDELTYMECVVFGRQTVMQKFSETISVFPKDKANRYCSNLLYEPNATNMRYVAGIDLLPAQKFVVREKELDDINGEGDATEIKEKSSMNGEMNGSQLINGEA